MPAVDRAAELAAIERFIASGQAIKRHRDGFLGDATDGLLRRDRLAAAAAPAVRKTTTRRYRARVPTLILELVRGKPPYCR